MPLHICNDGDIEIAECITLNSDLFDVAFNGTRMPELIPASIKADFRDGDPSLILFFIRDRLNSDLCAIQSHGAVFVPTSEFRRSFCPFLKEVDVTAFNALECILQCPRVGNPPVGVFVKTFPLCEVFRETIIPGAFVAFALPVDLMVAARQCHEVIVRLANSLQLAVQGAVALILLQFVFVRFHGIPIRHFIP